MPTLDASLAFFGASLLLGFAPGPDNIFVLVQAATYGRSAGFCVMLGLCTGLLVHTAAVALGLAALFAASSVAFTALKLAGALYLVYLAWMAFRGAGNPGGLPEGARVEHLRLYSRGVIMNLTNPKVVLFFLAFLPQFVEPRQGAVAVQICWFGMIFIAATIISFGIITWFAALLAQRFRQSIVAQRYLNYAAGVVFAGLALRLVLVQR